MAALSSCPLKSNEFTNNNNEADDYQASPPLEAGVRVLRMVVGSGPQGERIDNARIYTLDPRECLSLKLFPARSV